MTHVACQSVLVVDLASGGTTSKDRITFGAGNYMVDERGKYVLRSDGTVQISRAAHNFGEPMENPDWRPSPGGQYLDLHSVDFIDGGFGTNMSGDAIADMIAAAAKRAKALEIHGDQRERLFFSSAMQRRGLRFVEHPWTSASKPKAVELVRRWLLDRTLHISCVSPAVAEMFKAEMLGFEERVNPSGQLTFGARGEKHDDFVALLITLAHVELEQGLPSSPFRSYYPDHGLPKWEGFF